MAHCPFPSVHEQTAGTYVRKPRRSSLPFEMKSLPELRAEKPVPQAGARAFANTSRSILITAPWGAVPALHLALYTGGN